MYSPDWYAGYLSGVAYMVQTDAFRRIIGASENVPLIHMDDCYVMGLLAKEAEVRGRQSDLFTYGRTEPDACKSKLMASCINFWNLWWNLVFNLTTFPGELLCFQFDWHGAPVEEFESTNSKSRWMRTGWKSSQSVASYSRYKPLLFLWIKIDTTGRGFFYCVTRHKTGNHDLKSEFNNLLIITLFLDQAPPGDPA